MFDKKNKDMTKRISTKLAEILGKDAKYIAFSPQGDNGIHATFGGAWNENELNGFMLKIIKAAQGMAGNLTLTTEKEAKNGRHGNTKSTDKPLSA